MKDVEYIVGVYNFMNPYPEEMGESAYYLLYLLDEKGMLDHEGAKKLYDSNFKPEGLAGEEVKSPAKSIGPFDSVDRLNQYAFALCEEVNAARVSLLSVSEYNTLLENSHLASDFHRDLLEKGNVMENIERKKKGGFLSKFFS